MRGRPWSGGGAACLILPAAWRQFQRHMAFSKVYWVRGVLEERHGLIGGGRWRDVGRSGGVEAARPRHETGRRDSPRAPRLRRLIAAYGWRWELEVR